MNEDKSLHILLTEQQRRFQNLNPGLEREALSQIKPHLKSPHIIVITGLRRCGKSTLQAQLSQFFKNDYHYLNFDDERWTGFTVSDFNQVHKTLIELFGEKKYILMDEVQNIPRWELFVRRLHDAGHKLIITGSNASLLSREIGTHLTGRHRLIELLPFSFKEYLQFKKIPATMATTTESAHLNRALRHYLQSGGIPDAIKYPDTGFCAQLYQDIIYRDISARYAIDSLKNLKELSLYLVSNIGRSISFNKLRQMLMLGSVNTIKSYLDHLEISWLYFTINVYSPSVKQQQIAAKKVYCIDNGIMSDVGFQTSDNLGWLLENLVFLHLRRQTREIFYAKNDDGSEVDFLIRKGTKPVQLVQACTTLADESTQKREVSALVKAMAQHKLVEGTIVTLDQSQTLRVGKRKIHIVNAAEWLLSVSEASAKKLKGIFKDANLSTDDLRDKEDRL